MTRQEAARIKYEPGPNGDPNLRVRVTTVNGSGSSGNGSGPLITDVVVSEITTSSAKITWNTDEASDSQVEYGLTVAYGQSTTLNPSLVTSHSEVVSGLASGMEYHFRVKSKDAFGNLTTSNDFTFTTAVEP